MSKALGNRRDLFEKSEKMRPQALRRHVLVFGEMLTDIGKREMLGGTRQAANDVLHQFFFHGLVSWRCEALSRVLDHLFRVVACLRPPVASRKRSKAAKST